MHEPVGHSESPQRDAQSAGSELRCCWVPRVKVCLMSVWTPWAGVKDVHIKWCIVELGKKINKQKIFRILHFYKQTETIQ